MLKRALPSVTALIISLLTAMVMPAHGQVTVPDHMTEGVGSATGLYFTAPFIHGRGSEGMVTLLRNSRMDSAVIDFKDATGRVNYDTAIPELEAQESGLIDDMPGLITELHAANIRAIARIVCFSDDVFANAHPDRAIVDSRERFRGRVWTSWGTGGGWLDPWDTANHDMILAIAEEAEQMGFDEVQLDYIRFPVDDAREWAGYPDERDGVSRAQMLHGFLGRMDAQLDIPIGVDVFGIQAYWPGDRSGLGQDLELWRDHVDVFCPMLYVNSMTDWDVGSEHRGRRLVERGVRNLRDRLGAGPVIRPFLQGFEAGADEWNTAFIADQIRGARRGGADGFLFWHAGSNYGMVQRAMVGPARSLSPFPVPEDRREARTSMIGG